MAIFPNPNTKRDAAPAQDSALGKDPSPNELSFGAPGAPAFNAGQTPTPAFAPAPAPAPARATARQAQESVIASDVSIEGKISGAGNVRIAGRFTGDIAVEGDLSIEVGARVNGGIKARRVTVAGELEGNIESAERVEVVESGAMTGDVKAGTVTVAPGARMRGMVEFGWGGESGRKAAKTESTEAGSAA